MREAQAMATAIVTSRMRKPTVPAVPGSMRRNSSGLKTRPTSRAKAQPRITSAITVAMRTGVDRLRPKISSRWA